MTGIHFTVLNPDRHKPILFLLAVASVSGSFAGTIFSLQGLFAHAIFEGDLWRLPLITAVVLIVIFFLGLCRFGRFLIPLFLFGFSAFLSSGFCHLCAAENFLSEDFLFPVLLAMIFFLAVFFLCIQASIISKSFPILFSRHTRFAKPQRLFYVFEYILLNLAMAASFAGLYFFT